jgi:hypothetical protein
MSGQNAQFLVFVVFDLGSFLIIHRTWYSPRFCALFFLVSSLSTFCTKYHWDCIWPVSFSWMNNSLSLDSLVCVHRLVSICFLVIGCIIVTGLCLRDGPRLLCIWTSGCRSWMGSVSVWFSSIGASATFSSSDSLLSCLSTCLSHTSFTFTNAWSLLASAFWYFP